MMINVRQARLPQCRPSGVPFDSEPDDFTLPDVKFHHKTKLCRATDPTGKYNGICFRPAYFSFGDKFGKEIRCWRHLEYRDRIAIALFSESIE